MTVRGTGNMFHLGTVGAIASPVKPAPASPAPAPESVRGTAIMVPVIASDGGPAPIGCTETFSRSVPDGWGNSEIGGAFTGTAGSSVDGFMAQLTAIAARQALVSSRSKPFEILYRMRIPSADGEAAAGVANTSVSLSVATVDCTFIVLSRDDNTLDLYLAGGGEAQQSFNISNAYSGQWVWVRMRVTASGMQGKAWLDGESEPGAYFGTIALTNFPINRLIFQNGVVNQSVVDFDRFDIVSGCGNARTWSLPIEILWRGRIDYGSLQDMTLNFEVDLLSNWPDSWAGGSFAGVLLQNSSGDVPRMLIDTYGGGSAAPFWLGDTNPPNNYYDNALPDPDGRYFWVRMRVDVDRVRAKTWYDGNAEPGWQHEMFDTGSNPFNPNQDFTLYVFTNTSKFPISFLLDSVQIVTGYGSSPFTVDNFNRSVASGWGMASSGVDSWVDEDQPSQVSVDGSHGRWDRVADAAPTGSVMTLSLPNGVAPE